MRFIRAELDASPLVLRILERACAVRVILLALMAVYAATAVGVDWHYVAGGGRLLLGWHADTTAMLPGKGAGLHFYAGHPDVQIGPLALLLGGLITLCGPFAWSVAVALEFCMGLQVIAALAARATGATVRQRFGMLVVDCLVIISFGDAAFVWGHLDDVLVLWACVRVMSARDQGRQATLVCFLVFAVAAKPTAVVLLPLALPPLRLWRSSSSWWPFAATLGGALVVWLPFVLGDSATLGAGAPQIIVLSGSALKAFGFEGYAGWVRPVQLGLGLICTCACAIRGLWWVVPAVGFGIRLLVDPGEFSYYSLYGVLGGTLALCFGPTVLRTLPLMLCFFVFMIMPFLSLPNFTSGILRALASVALVMEMAPKTVARLSEGFTRTSRPGEKRRRTDPA